MSPFECFKIYKALYLHFTTSYDYFKYKGNFNFSENMFLKRNDAYFFKKLAKVEYPQNFILANLSYQTYQVFDLVTKEECQKNYEQWTSFRKAYSYRLQQDFNKISKIEDIINLYRKNEISIETVSQLIKHNQSLFQDLNKISENNVLWNHFLKNHLCKYISFLPKQEKYSKLTIDKLNELGYK